MAKKLTNKLAHLPQDITIERVVEHPDSTELFISYPQEARICPRCGSSDCVKHDSGRSQTIRHIVVSGRSFLLTFHVPRLRCKSCGSTFYRHPYFVQPGFNLSQASFSAVCEGLMTTRSLRDISIDTGTTESIVSSVLTSVDFAVPGHLPQTLCIDEFKGSSGEWDSYHSHWSINRYHCNIADGDVGCVFDILERIDAPYLTEYFHSYSIETRRKVKFFCCDMHGGFISIAKSCFPNAVICIDNFHTVRLLKDNIDEIRRALWRHYQKLSSGEVDPVKRANYASLCKLLKGSARLLVTSEHNYEPYFGSNVSNKRERLSRLFSLSNDLREAFDAYQEFLVILHTPEYALQRADLTEWIRKYSCSENEGTRRCINTIKHYRSYIQNAWKYGKSNSPCEGLNNKIKVLKRNGYGAHSFTNFRQRILFSCGYTSFVRRTFTIASQKQLSAEKEV